MSSELLAMVPDYQKYEAEFLEDISKDLGLTGGTGGTANTFRERFKDVNQDLDDWEITISL